VSRYQKGKTNLDFTEARDSEWPWNQLDHMQVCTSHHASTPPLSFYTPDALLAARLSASKHRQIIKINILFHVGRAQLSITGKESVPIQLAQCRFPGLAISNAKILKH